MYPQTVQNYLEAGGDADAKDKVSFALAGMAVGVGIKVGSESRSGLAIRVRVLRMIWSAGLCAGCGSSCSRCGLAVCVLILFCFAIGTYA